MFEICAKLEVYMVKQDWQILTHPHLGNPLHEETLGRTRVQELTSQ